MYGKDLVQSVRHVVGGKERGNMQLQVGSTTASFQWLRDKKALWRTKYGALIWVALMLGIGCATKCKLLKKRGNAIREELPVNGCFYFR